MSEVTIVSVDLPGFAERSYPILIQPNLLQQLDQNIAAMAKLSTSHWMVITDDIVGPLYLDRLLARVSPFVDKVSSLVVPHGESSKSLSLASEIWEQMLQKGVDRKATVVALGGGVVGDLVGFVAATFSRGLDFVQIPTTLLAQVDSSVGGKVGINLPRAKNIVGGFWQPKLVLIDPVSLNSLDARNYRSGMAEVVKYGVIMAPDFFEHIESSIQAIDQRDPQLLSHIIATCCRLKASIVEQDEFETTGLRALLNYGHTFGHAIESVCGYGTWLHGEAVAIGMTCAARLAVDQNLMDRDSFVRQTNLLRGLQLPVDVPSCSHSQLLAAMKVDKKVAAGQLNLILPKQIGEVALLPAPEEAAILASLQNRY